MFGCDPEGCYVIAPGGKPATAFLFELIAHLQSSATVPMIDIRAYAQWLMRYLADQELIMLRTFASSSLVNGRHIDFM